MQAQKTVQIVSVRFIALAFALLAALLLASAAGYVIRGGAPSAGSIATPTTLHVQQMTDRQMERQHDATSAAGGKSVNVGPGVPLPDRSYGVGH